jgi:hypothetical protein
MKNVPSPQPRAIHRSSFLRAAGVGIALPLLEYLVPSAGWAAKNENVGAPRRLLAIHVPLGMMPQFFFPAPASPSGDIVSSPYLDLLSEHRGLFTIFSGMSHPGVDGNHHAAQCFLTGAPHPGQPTFRNSQSLDQMVAEQLGLQTRFAHLALSVKRNDHYSDSLAVSRSGVTIPSESSPKRLYRSLFIEGTEAEKMTALRRIEAGGSVLDLVREKAQRLQKTVPAADRARMDQYFQSVRDVEMRLHRSVDWEHRPKPSVSLPEPEDISDANRVIEKSKLMFDLIRLAFQTDSTRVVTLSLSTFSVTAQVPGVKSETHELTHHGNQPEKIEQLRKLEEAQMRAFSSLIQELRDTREQGGSLLDHTQVLYGSCLGNANSHSTQNLPLILAGGGYRHPGHLSFDPSQNEPLAKLFVTMMQRMGMETDRFAAWSGTIGGLL